MWHDAYNDPTSSLSRRRRVVEQRLAQVLRDVPSRSPLLSLCAGDGGDVIPVLAARADTSPIRAVLIENDETLAHRAVRAAATAGLTGVEVRCQDAGDRRSFADVLPVGVLLLCGILGNIDHLAVKDVIDVVPSLLVPGGTVIWTRGSSDPDRRPEVRGWFEAAGLAEVSFDGAPELYGVGVNRLVSESTAMRRELPDRVFTFV